MKNKLKIQISHIWDCKINDVVCTWQEAIDAKATGVVVDTHSPVNVAHCTFYTVEVERPIQDYIRIGFCKPKYYKQSIWRKAKRIMEKLVETGLVENFDFGRGKGKYITSSALRDLKLTYKQEIDLLANQYTEV
jgi:hypothetical protein